MALDFFYDAQIRNIVLHLQRIFMQFQVATGKDANGEYVLQRVPCMFASNNRQVETILYNNSSNTVSVYPRITLAIDNIDIARDRVQCQFGSNQQGIIERQWDESNQQYTSERGNTVLLERYNPVPIDITIKVYIGTTNIEQKLQLFEQIRLLFNPSIPFQKTDNILDWSSMSNLELTNITWSSQGVNPGENDTVDTMEMTFKLEAFLVPPAKLTRMTNIQTILSNLGEGDSCNDILNWGDNDIIKMIGTPGNHPIKVEGTTITLLNNSVTPTNWIELFNLYGRYVAGRSQIRVRALTTDIENDNSDIIGTVTINSNDSTKLVWNIDVDTLPATTLPAVNAFIDPMKSFPNNGILPIATSGQRYLLLSNMSDECVAWGIVGAKENDIIEYNGSNWVIVFDNSSNTTTQVVASLTTTNRLMWTQEHGWVDPINGVWNPGWWRLFLDV